MSEPLIILLCINYLPKIIYNANVYMNVDDTILWLNKALNQDLKALDSWLRGNIFSQNVGKRKSIVISIQKMLAVFKG